MKAPLALTRPDPRKKCEFRCYNRHKNLYHMLLKVIKDNPLFKSCAFILQIAFLPQSRTFQAHCCHGERRADCGQRSSPASVDALTRQDQGRWPRIKYVDHALLPFERLCACLLLAMFAASIPGLLSVLTSSRRSPLLLGKSSHCCHSHGANTLSGVAPMLPLTVFVERLGGFFSPLICAT